MDAILSDLNSQVDNWNGRGSGFIIDRVIHFVLCINMYRPLHGSTYIHTPEWLKGKQCIVNVKNDDNKCFLYAVLSALYPAEIHTDWLSHYMPYVSTLSEEGLEYPVSSKQIPIFEKNNPTLSVNVLYSDFDSKGFCVLYRSPHRDRKHHINLLQ